MGKFIGIRISLIFIGGYSKFLALWVILLVGCFFFKKRYRFLFVVVLKSIWLDDFLVI